MSATTHGLGKHFDVIFGTAITFVVLVTSTTALRVTAKLLAETSFKFEDYTILFAFILYIATEALLMRCVVVGRHAEVLNDKYDQYYTELASVYSDFYFAIMALCIASMSLFYRRVFHAKRAVRILATAILVIDVGWWISSTIIEIIFPATYPETYPGNPGIRSITANYLTWWLASGIIEVVTVITTIMIPVGQLRKLHMDRRKKIVLSITFSFSFVCVGTGIARLATLYRPHAEHFDGSIGDVWINVHLGSAIISANLASCWPIISHRKKILSYLTSGRKGSSDASKSSGSSRATLRSRTSTSDPEKGPTVHTYGPGSRKSSTVTGANVVQGTDSIESVNNQENITVDEHDGHSSMEELDYHAIVTSGSVRRVEVQRPPMTHLRS